MKRDTGHVAACDVETNGGSCDCAEIQAEAANYLAAMLRSRGCREGALDYGWSKLSPAARDEVTKRLKASPPGGEAT